MAANPLFEAKGNTMPSKKTSPKTMNKKTTKPAGGSRTKPANPETKKSRSANLEVVEVEPATVTTIDGPQSIAQCPAGGDHEWEGEGDESSCKKCHEPQAVPGPKAKTAKQSMTKKKLSAIDAAALVLARSAAPMNCMALVEAMASGGLWESPGGKTPHATLYSAILREIATKGEDARFAKADRGTFVARNLAHA